MERFDFPTTILFGEGALEAFVSGLAEQHLLFVVTDPHLEEIGLVSELTRRLQERGIPWTLFSQIAANPVEEDVVAGVEAFRGSGADAIVALGGGAPIDVAKAIALSSTHPAPLGQYAEAEGGERICTPLPPLYAIPTTAGTGSEVGRSSVIILSDTGRKSVICHPTLMPRIAVLEPTLTVGLPPHLTAATGIDALTHCIEAFLAPSFHPMADGIALEGIRLIRQSLPDAWERGTDIEARARMQIAATMGATAFQKGLGMVHALAHPLSSEFDLHHGLANALLLPAALRFLEAAPLTPEQRNRLERLSEIFRARGDGESALLSERLSRFIEALGIEGGLGRMGIPQEALERLSELAWADPSHETNMVPVTRDDLLRTYRDAW
ncbi:MAG: iron-containing alcohol dehydrogenase [Deltaproteobacteria bacterium]|nr:MAG: iron-containing alcohol dehydrogenase [Deltaproteobacteria bacterium]